MPNRVRPRPPSTAVLLVAVAFSTGAHDQRVWAVDQQAVDHAVARAVRYLRGEVKTTHGGRRTLAAYALFKGGLPATSDEVSSVLREVLAKFDGGVYQPVRSNETPYEAGVEAMLLADIDPVAHRPQLQAIAGYLIGSRLAVNVWDYKGPDSPGDTSVTQYACLGLWAAARAGVEIPLEVWDKVMLWHFRSHRPDGGFTYMPGMTRGPGGGQSTLNMTSAAIGTTAIAAMYLHPERMRNNRGFSGPRASRGDSEQGRKFGVLERAQPSIPQGDATDAPTGLIIRRQPQEPYEIKTSFAEYEQHTERALAWMGGNFQVQNRVGPAMYYYYSLERMGALTKVEKIGTVDWFDVCAEFLVRQQSDNGSWNLSIYDRGGPYVIGTSFGVLFLTRSTARLLNQLPPADLLGGGLLAGGRGLPEDLSQLELDEGRVETRKPSGPLDELLNELTKVDAEKLFDVQQEIVEKIQLGDRAQLVGQTERLLELLEHPDPQIRRTAMWALGRSDDLTLVRHALSALVDDPDVDVLVEAHHALCWFSRRPLGFGLPPHPLHDLAPDATDQQKAAAVGKWRAQAVHAWGKWYLQVCPYDERDNPFTVSLQQHLKDRP